MLGRLQTPKASIGRVGRMRTVSVRAEAISLNGFSKLAPTGELVLVKVAIAEEKTASGILLPSSAQRRPTSGDVVATGDGRTAEGQKAMTLKQGETVIYSRFGIGVTDIEMNGEQYALIREEDCIGVMPNSRAHADDIPQMRPLGDRVLIKVQETSDETVGGVILTEASKERPLIGTIVRVGPGKADKDGKVQEIKLKEGDRVVYFKYGGDPMATSDGTKYTVMRASEVLARA